MVEVMKIMATSKHHHKPKPQPETPGQSWASLSQSLVISLLLSPGSWYAQGFVCALKESVSPVLWKFCNQIPLAFKVKSIGDSQSFFCQILRLGSLLWSLELSHQCENFFGIIVLQFVSCPHSSSSQIVDGDSGKGPACRHRRCGFNS